MRSLKMFCKDFYILYFYISISISISSSKLESAYRLRTRFCVCLKGLSQGLEKGSNDDILTWLIFQCLWNFKVALSSLMPLAMPTQSVNFVT